MEIESKIAAWFLILLTNTVIIFCSYGVAAYFKMEHYTIVSSLIYGSIASTAIYRHLVRYEKNKK